jgi:hypothetical protein
MVGICFSSLALLAGILGVFGLSWYKGKQNDRKRNKAVREKEEHFSELTA